jgi:hypothetical protein
MELEKIHKEIIFNGMEEYEFLSLYIAPEIDVG